MKRKILIYTLTVLTVFACMSTALQAAPARRSPIVYTQPDGSTFRGHVCGDEFCRYRTTESGRIIAKDTDGWWCYASYGADGSLNVSGTRVSASNAAISTFSVNGGTQFFPKVSERRTRFNKAIAEKPMMRRFLAQNGAATKSGGTTPRQKHGLIILAAFKDVPFRHSREAFVNMLTQKGYSYNGATGSAMDYFNDQFGGLVEFSFDVSEIVTLPENREYYGGNTDDNDDRNPVQMVIDACRLAAQSGTDFSGYDDDNDGYVDNVFIFYAGENEAETDNDDCVWSHAYCIESGAGEHLRLNGKKIDSYACTAELTVEYEEIGGAYGPGGFKLAGIGTFCHEYSHTFGLPDLYDTDYQKSGGTAEALWYVTGLMDGGNTNNDGNTPPYYNAIDMECLGLGEQEKLTDGTYTLAPLHTGNKYFRIDTDREDEYFLIECRDNSLWDKYILGKGLLVYHIDKSGNSAGKSDNYGKTLTAAERWNNYNEVNCRPDRQCADLIEANPQAVSKACDKNTKKFTPTVALIESVFFPYGTNNSLGAANGLRYCNGKYCPLELGEIRTLDDGSVSFIVKTVAVPSDRGKFPTISFDGAKRGEDGSFLAGNAIPFTLADADDAVSVKWFFNEKEFKPAKELNLSESGLLKAVVYYQDGSTATVSKKMVIR